MENKRCCMECGYRKIETVAFEQKFIGCAHPSNLTTSWDYLYGETTVTKNPNFAKINNREGTCKLFKPIERFEMIVPRNINKQEEYEEYTSYKRTPIKYALKKYLNN